jgi:hypothetical protein
MQDLPDDVFDAALSLHAKVIDALEGSTPVMRKMIIKTVLAQLIMFYHSSKEDRIKEVERVNKILLKNIERGDGP